jgi:hypothetical protein
MNDRFCRTLWVKSINNAVEECQAAEKSILADKAMFTVPGKRLVYSIILKVNFFLKKINAIQKQLLHVFFLSCKKLLIYYHQQQHLNDIVSINFYFYKNK